LNQRTTSLACGIATGPGTITIGGSCHGLHFWVPLGQSQAPSI
jgi:hypothetical protein